jgi:hypothetical protein
MLRYQLCRHRAQQLIPLLVLSIVPNLGEIIGKAWTFVVVSSLESTEILHLFPFAIPGPFPFRVMDGKTIEFLAFLYTFFLWIFDLR